MASDKTNNNSDAQKRAEEFIGRLAGNKRNDRTNENLRKANTEAETRGTSRSAEGRTLGGNVGKTPTLNDKKAGAKSPQKKGKR
jgi:hypothetical protein